MILITGANGYVGRHVVARLVARGERIRCLVRDVERAGKVLPAEKVELVQGDTTRAETLKGTMEGVETVIHAAFMTADLKQSAGNRYETTNVKGTANLIAAAKE